MLGSTSAAPLAGLEARGRIGIERTRVATGRGGSASRILTLKSDWYVETGVVSSSGSGMNSGGNRLLLKRPSAPRLQALMTTKRSSMSA